MAGYTQAELTAIYQKAIPGLDDSIARRYADIVEKFYTVVTPTYNYQTSDYLGRTTRALVEIATACYGQHYSLANLIQKIKDLGYPDIFATNAADVIPAIYACINADIGDECLTNGTTFASVWATANDFAVSGAKAVYTHSSGGGTITQVDTNLATAITASRWYLFDYEITAVPAVAANLTSMVITATGGIPAASKSIQQTAIGKYSEVFYSASAQGTGHDFIITGASSDAVSTYSIDNVSLKLIGATLSTDPLSSSYVKPYIAKIVHDCAYLLRQGENLIYNI